MGIILYCHNLYADHGGGEYSVYRDDVELLKKAGHVVVEYEENNSSILEATWLGKIGYMIRSFYNPRTVNNIRLLAKQYGVKAAIVQNTYLVFSPSIYTAMNRLGIPIIQMVYNYRFICPNAHLYTQGRICHRCVQGNFLHAISKKCIRNSYLISLWYSLIVFIKIRILKIDRFINYYITPDQFLKKKLIEGGINREKILIMENPFDVKGLNISRKDDGYFLFVGRLIKQKGIFTFLTVAKILKNISFVIIGYGEEEHNVKKYIMDNGLDNVRYLAAQYGNDMLQILEKARALVVPSEWYDNYPVVISYAYAMGKAVIATNINGIPEVVKDKETGLLFKMHDIRDLSEKISILFEDKQLAKHLGQNGRKYLLEYLSPEKRVNKMSEIIENLIS